MYNQEKIKGEREIKMVEKVRKWKRRNIRIFRR
jgi:hypothetical protein